MTDKTSTFTILEQGTTRVLLLPVLIAASTLAVAIAMAQETASDIATLNGEGCLASVPTGRPRMQGALYGHAAASGVG